MSNREVVLCHPLRTAIGTYGGSLKATPAPELGTAVIKAVIGSCRARAGRARWVQSLRDMGARVPDRFAPRNAGPAADVGARHRVNRGG